MSFVNEPSSGRDALFINRGVILEGGKNVDVFVSQGKRLRSSQVLGNNARELFEFQSDRGIRSLEVNRAHASEDGDAGRIAGT